MCIIHGSIIVLLFFTALKLTMIRKQKREEGGLRKSIMRVEGMDGQWHLSYKI